MEVRINKFLSEAGVCSRREADRQIEAGNVTIDGRTAQMGDKVMEEQVVCFQGKPVKKEEEMILIAFHKPAGIVCTAEKREKNNIIDYDIEIRGEYFYDSVYFGDDKDYPKTATVDNDRKAIWLEVDY